MQMIDVMKKLREIADNNPEAGRALDSLHRMNGQPVAEAVQVTTTGSDAVLAQILKLAGMIGAEEVIDFNANAQDNMAMGAAPGAQMDVGHDMGIPFPTSLPPAPMSGGLPMQPPGDIPGAAPTPGGMPDMGAMEAAEGTDERPYSNSPHEYQKGINAAVPNGNDLAKSKLTAPKVAGGDNPVHVAVTFD